MPNNTDIESILADLYAIDPELKSHDTELRKVINQLLTAKPDITPNKEFIESLKRTVLERSETILAHKPTFLEKLHSMQKTFLYPATAAVVLIVAATAGVMAFLKNPQLANRESGSIALQSSGEFAFGPLTSNQNFLGKGSGIGLGGGGGFAGVSMNTAAPTTAPTAEESATRDTAIGGDAKLSIYPAPYNVYTYTYKGEPLNLTESKLPVIRRIKGITNQNSNSLLSPISSLFNISKITNAKAQNISVMEDRDYGYAINVDFLEGGVSFSQNWQRWPHPENDCRDEACYKRYRVTEADIPGDAELIAIADRFLSDYGIARAGFGDAEVRSDWRIYYEQSTDKANYYFPESITVIYPQLINGEKVYDESGYPTGLTINVNVRYNRVDGVWGLTTQSFESSNYSMETNATKIIELATKGGYNYNYPMPYPADSGVQANQVVLDLGTPEQILMKSYRWNGSTSDELYVPALRFPIINMPKDQPFYATSITIPLASELFDARYNPETGGGFGGGPIILQDTPAVKTEPAVTDIAPEATPAAQ